MLKLSTPDLHAMLNDRVVGVLQDKGIATIADLLHTDSNKLKQYLNIELVDLSVLKNDLWKIIGILPINGLHHYNTLMKQSNYIPTGIKSLDDLLGGGFLTGNVIDMCGLPASGKTQLYTTIAINWAANYDHQTFVVDTNGDFSGDRIHQILLNRNEIAAEKRKHVMRSIKVEKCNSPLKLIEMIRNLLDQVNSYPRLKMLVIDSLPALWFLFHGNKRSLNQRNLAILGNLLRKLAVEHAIVVVTINIVTRPNIVRSIIGDKRAIDDANQNEMDPMDRTKSMETTMTTTVPALGKYWKSICSSRLQIECQSTDTTKLLNERTVRILKNNQNQTDIHCMVQLTNTGII